MLILTGLIGTLVVVGVVQAVLSARLVGQFKALRRTEARVEHFNDALALLTEATETGFRSAAVELQRVAAVQRHSHGPSDVQQRLERAAALGNSVSQIASQEGLSEGEVQLRLHMTQPLTAAQTKTENSIGTM